MIPPTIHPKQDGPQRTLTERSRDRVAAHRLSAVAGVAFEMGEDDQVAPADRAVGWVVGDAGVVIDAPAVTAPRIAAGPARHRDPRRGDAGDLPVWTGPADEPLSPSQIRRAGDLSHKVISRYFSEDAAQLSPRIIMCRPDRCNMGFHQPHNPPDHTREKS